MIADLHIHTTASDGLLDPLRIVHEAKIARLRKIAITDHDTVNGLLALKKDGILSQRISEPAIIPGIELNADYPGREVHILGYFIDIENPTLKAHLDFLTANRLKRLQAMVQKINSLGYELEYDYVMSLVGNSAAVGRPHLAKALVRLGYFKNIGQVFETLIGKDCPAYIAQYRLSPAEAVGLIKSAGGIAVLAHPGLIGDDIAVRRIINAGLAGLEVYHPAHSEAQIQKYLALARNYNLKITGGSDFHGIAGRYPEKLGIFCITADLADKLSEK